MHSIANCIMITLHMYCMHLYKVTILMWYYYCPVYLYKNGNGAVIKIESDMDIEKKDLTNVIQVNYRVYDDCIIRV